MGRSMGIAAAFAAAVAAAFAAPAAAAEWACTTTVDVTGGRLFVTVEGEGAAAAAVSGSLELSTASAPAPLGLRNGTYQWVVDRPETSADAAILALTYNATLPLKAAPGWGVDAGMVVPGQLSFLTPLLRNPLGGPAGFSSVTLITGNGIYVSGSDWKLRTGQGAMAFTNAPESPGLQYSRELLQLIAADVTEPIVLFLTPTYRPPADSIAAFEAAGIAEAPGRLSQVVAEAQAAGAAGQCPPPEPPP